MTIQQTNSTSTLAHRYAQTLADKKALEEQTKELARQLAALDESLQQAMLADGIADLAVQLDDGAKMRLFMRSETFVSVEDQEALCEALLRLGEDGIVKTSVNAMTLKAYVREQEEHGGVPAEVAQHIEITRAQRIGTRSL